MSSQNQEPRGGEERAPELELNKETLQDLDIEPADGNEVKGGGSIVAVPSLGAPWSTGQGFTTGMSMSSGMALSRER